MKICIFSGSRSEYGLLKKIILDLQNDRFFKTDFIVSGSHLEKDYGLTIGGGYQNTGATGDFVGSVDDVRVWKVGLSDEEVAFLYNDQNTTCSRSDFIFSSLNTNIVSVTGTNTAFITGSGDSVIQVTLPDDGNYNSATATFSLEVSKGDPIISHGDLSKNYGESFTLTTSSTSDANVIYTITDTSIATVSGSTVTTKGAGSTTILLNQLELDSIMKIVFFLKKRTMTYKD